MGDVTIRFGKSISKELLAVNGESCSKLKKLTNTNLPSFITSRQMTPKKSESLK